MTNSTAAAPAKDDHARQNAAAWMDTVAQMVSALECDYDRLQELLYNEERTEEENVELRELVASVTIDGDQMESAEAARERITESPLSVQVRSGWTDPGAEFEAEEFEILLSTGGPALRIRGELDQHKQPSRAYLQYQDWGTPWTDYLGENMDGGALLTFYQQFYFGE